MKNRRGDTVTRRHGDKERPAPVPESPRLTISAAPRSSPLITLLTDFGTADYFVGAVKGVILTSNPAAPIIDITHDIPAHDVAAAAFTLLAACPAFPKGTIHLAVVDPGVGSSRRPLLIQTRDQMFVGPDNGIFSYVCDSVASQPKIFHLTNQEYFRRSVSPTFHGRDVFAPVAAALSQGVRPAELGTQIDDFIRLPSLRTVPSRDGSIRARIIHIDRFGNCITNITRSDLTAEMIAGGAKLRVKGKIVKSFRDYFAADSGSEKLFAIWGSAGFLEIAMMNHSAARLLQAKRGDAVVVSQT